jgi:hypothetical protein
MEMLRIAKKVSTTKKPGVAVEADTGSSGVPL